MLGVVQNAVVPETTSKSRERQRYFDFGAIFTFRNNIDGRVVTQVGY